MSTATTSDEREAEKLVFLQWQLRRGITQVQVLEDAIQQLQVRYLRAVGSGRDSLWLKDRMDALSRVQHMFCHYLERLMMSFHQTGGPDRFCTECPCCESAYHYTEEEEARGDL